MQPITPSLLALPLLSLLSAGCTVGLAVRSETQKEAVRTPLPGKVAFTAERSGDALVLRVARADEVRVDTFETTTTKRYRRTELFGGELSWELLMPLSSPVDLCIALSAPFRSDYDVAWGLLGGLAAVLVPGVATCSPARFDDYHKIERFHWDTSISRRLVSSDVQPAPVGLPADLRVVTDQEVLELRTNEAGEARIALARLTTTSGRARLTVDHAGELYAVDVVGSQVTVTRVGAVAK